jgi:hypothetical protein
MPPKVNKGAVDDVDDSRIVTMLLNALDKHPELSRKIRECVAEPLKRELVRDPVFGEMVQSKIEQEIANNDVSRTFQYF